MGHLWDLVECPSDNKSTWVLLILNAQSSKLWWRLCTSDELVLSQGLLILKPSIPVSERGHAWECLICRSIPGLLSAIWSRTHPADLRRPADLFNLGWCGGLRLIKQELSHWLRTQLSMVTEIRQMPVRCSFIGQEAMMAIFIIHHNFQYFCNHGWSLLRDWFFEKKQVFRATDYNHILWWSATDSRWGTNWNQGNSMWGWGFVPPSPYSMVVAIWSPPHVLNMSQNPDITYSLALKQVLSCPQPPCTFGLPYSQMTPVLLPT